jgi:hypothetical protein
MEMAENALEEARDQLRTVEHLDLANREFQEAWGAYRLALSAFNESLPASGQAVETYKSTRPAPAQDATNSSDRREPIEVRKETLASQSQPKLRLRQRVCAGCQTWAGSFMPGLRTTLMQPSFLSRKVL